MIQNNWKVRNGVSRFLQEISDVSADAPQSPEWFCRLVLEPLLKNKAFKLADIKFLYEDLD